MELNLKNNIEHVTIHCRMKNFDESGIKEDEIPRMHETLNRTLVAMKNVCEKILNEELDLNAPHKLWNDDFFSEAERKSLDLFDYDFFVSSFRKT